jgi:hypothetical protein
VLAEEAAGGAKGTEQAAADGGEERFGSLTEVEIQTKTDKRGVLRDHRFVYSGKLVTSEVILSAWERFLAERAEEKKQRAERKNSRKKSEPKAAAKKRTGRGETGWHAHRPPSALPPPTPLLLSTPRPPSRPLNSSSSSPPTSGSVVAATPAAFYRPLPPKAVTYNFRDRHTLATRLELDSESDDDTEENDDALEPLTLAIEEAEPERSDEEWQDEEEEEEEEEGEGEEGEEEDEEKEEM